MAVIPYRFHIGDTEETPRPLLPSHPGQAHQLQKKTRLNNVNGHHTCGVQEAEPSFSS